MSRGENGMPADTGPAWASLQSLLESYGLGELIGWARQEFIDGKSQDEILIDLEKQPAVQAKFKPVFERRRLGLPPVSFADVVEYRRQVNQLEQYYGIPASFVDADKLMISDVSAAELRTRLDDYQRYVLSGPAEVRTQLQELYGIGTGGLIANAIDPTLAVPLLEQQYKAADAAAATQLAGLDQVTRDQALRLAQLGVGLDNVTALSQVRRMNELLNPLGASEGDTRLTQFQATEAVAGGNAAAADTIQKRRDLRVAAFASTGGAFAGTQTGLSGLGSANQ